MKVMLSNRSIRILMIFASQQRAQAEATAAAETRRLDALARSMQTLAGYALDLDNRRLAGIQTGHDLLIHGQFLAATIRAQLLTENEKAQTELAQERAIMMLGETIERQNRLSARNNEISSQNRHLRDLRAH